MKIVPQHLLQYIIFVLFSLFSLYSEGYAQMFSVDETAKKQDLFDITINIGLNLTDLQHRNPSQINSVPNFSFSDPIYNLSADLSYISILAGFGFNIGPENDIDAFYLNLRLGNISTLFRTQYLRIGFPLFITTETFQLRKDASIDSNSRLELSSFMLGTGTYASFSLGSTFEFKQLILINYGFGTHSYGNFGGSKWQFIIDNTMVLLPLFNNYLLALGYQYQYDFYNIDSNNFDYTARSHLLKLGITF